MGSVGWTIAIDHIEIICGAGLLYDRELKFVAFGFSQHRVCAT